MLGQLVRQSSCQDNQDVLFITLQNIFRNHLCAYDQHCIILLILKPPSSQMGSRSNHALSPIAHNPHELLHTQHTGAFPTFMISTAELSRGRHTVRIVFNDEIFGNFYVGGV